MARYNPGGYVLTIPGDVNDEFLEGLGEALSELAPPPLQVIAAEPWADAKELLAVVSNGCVRMGLPHKSVLNRHIAGFVIQQSGRMDEIMMGDPGTLDLLLPELQHDPERHNIRVSIAQYLDSLISANHQDIPPSGVSSDREWEAYWRRSLRRMFSEPLAANPMYQTRDSFLELAKRHWDARAAVLRKVGLRRQTSPGRPGSGTVPQYAKWFVLVQYCDLTPTEVAQRENASRTAVDTGIRYFARQIGVALRPLKKTGRRPGLIKFARRTS